MIPTGPDQVWSDVDAIQDVDGDGFRDIVASKHGEGSSDKGEVLVISGATGATIRSWVSTRWHSQIYGTRVAVVDDLNGDGFEDILVGDPKSKRIEVRSHFGLLLGFINGGGNDVDFGLNFKLVPDMDGDGVREILIGCHHGSNGGLKRCGTITLVSGRTLRLIHRWSGSVFHGELGLGISSTPDIDGDGFDDIVAGSEQEVGSRGALHFFSSGSGAWLGKVNGYDLFGTGAPKHTYFGGDIHRIPDQDGDDLDDLIVPARGTGRNYVLGSATLSIVHEYPEGYSFRSIGPEVGDLDNNGAADFGTAAKYSGSWRLDFHSGENGSLLSSLVEQLQGLDAIAVQGSPSDADYSIVTISSQYLSRWSFSPFLTGDSSEYSISAGTPVDFTVDFPESTVGYRYAVLVSASGLGATSYGVDIPLQSDSVLQWTAATRNHTLLTTLGWRGTLDGDGNSFATLDSRLALPSSIIGLVHFAAIAMPSSGELAEFASFAVPLTILP